jgi:hypothetical protein
MGKQHSLTRDRGGKGLMEVSGAGLTRTKFAPPVSTGGNDPLPPSSLSPP